MKRDAQNANGMPISGEPHETGPAPRDRAQLVAFLARLGIRVSEGGPLDYLEHAFLERDEPGDAVVWANRGGGKTFLGALATMLDLVFKPGIEVRILGGSMEQSKRMHAHLRRLFSKEELAPLVRGRITDTRLRLRNGSEAELLSQSQASVRGTRVQKLRCDEVELFSRDVWEAAQLVTRSVTLRTPGGGAVFVRGTIECLSTMHVPHGIMHDLVREARQGGRRLFKWGVVDVLAPCGDEHRCGEGGPGQCPLWGECAGLAKTRDPARAGHVAVADALKMKRRVSLATWRSEMLCERPKRTDAVLPEFDPARHVAELGPPPEGSSFIAGMDFGYRAPCATIWAAVDPAGVVRVMDERVLSGVVIAEHAKALREIAKNHGWPEPEWVGVDPAGRQVSDQTGECATNVLRHAGLSVRDRRLQTQVGLGLIRARLEPAGGGPPGLLVHPRCARLIESMERYHYDPKNPESLIPVKDGFDHAVDALRYMIVNLDRPGRAAFARYA